MKGNNMTNKTSPASRIKLRARSQVNSKVAVRNPASKARLPARTAKNPKAPHEQTSDTDT